MKTDELIDRLASEAGPVRRVPAPWVRTMRWLSIAMPGVALVVAMMSPRPDLAARMADSRFLLEEAAALATAVTAAMAAFCMVAPGHDRRLALVPLLPLAFWLGTLGQGCIASWLASGDGALRLMPDWLSLPGIATTGAIPALAMLAMLRRGAPLAPRLTVLLGALASGAMANVGLRLFHEQDASLMVLVWQVGSVALYCLLATWLGGERLLNWQRNPKG